MATPGTEGLTPQQVYAEIKRGGRFVVFPYTISLIVITFSRSSEVRFVRAGEGTFGAALPYILLSFFFGWWGFPFGFIYTPISLFHCFSGGKDVTNEVT